MKDAVQLSNELFRSVFMPLLHHSVCPPIQERVSNRVIQRCRMIDAPVIRSAGRTVTKRFAIPMLLREFLPQVGVTYAELDMQVDTDKPVIIG